MINHHNLSEVSLHWFFSLIHHFGWGGIFLSMLVESCGVPFPTEGAFLIGQQLIVTGKANFWLMYLFICLSQIVGSILAYGLGRWLGKRLGRRLENNQGYQRASTAVTKWYKRYGSLTVLIGRLVGYVRPWSSLLAGAADFPFGPFIIWTIIGTLLIVYPSMKITAIIFLLWSRSPFLHLYISLGFLLSFFALAIYGIFRRAQAKKETQKEN